MKSIIGCEAKHRMDLSFIPEPIEHDLLDDQALEKILNSYFHGSKKPTPLEITMCGDLFEMEKPSEYTGLERRKFFGFHQPTIIRPNCGAHSITVLAQRCRVNKEGAPVRELLVNTHWGSCQTISSYFECDQGKIWVNTKDLGRNSFRATGIDSSKLR